MKKSIFVIFFLSMLTYSEENFLKAGIGGLFRKDIYNFEDKTHLYPIPALYLNYNNFYFIAPFEAGYHFYVGKDLRLTGYGRYNLFTGYDHDDFIEPLKNMNDRDDDLHLGLRARYSVGPTRLTFTAYLSTDVINKSNGTLASLEITQPVPIGKKTLLFPFIAGQYISQNYADYYFGITDKESKKLDNINSYNPDSSYKLSTGIKAMSNLTDNIDMIFSGEYYQYGSEIADSPLTRGGSNYSFLLGINYKFNF